MTTSLFMAGLAAAAFWLSPVAGAAPLVITAYGTITSASTHVADPWTGSTSPFVPGEQITATLSYDSDAQFGVVPVHLYTLAYWPADGRITTASGWSQQAFSWFNVGASDITFTGQLGDPRYSSGFPLFSYSTNLSFGHPFATIPPSSIDASDFLTGTIAGLYAPTPLLDFSFTAKVDRITALVTPIPAAGWLFATGLAGLAVLRRKRAAGPFLARRQP